jgi:hypothetical protein
LPVVSNLRQTKRALGSGHRHAGGSGGQKQSRHEPGGLAHLAGAREAGQGAELPLSDEALRRTRRQRPDRVQEGGVELQQGQEVFDPVGGHARPLRHFGSGMGFAGVKQPLPLLGLLQQLDDSRRLAGPRFRSLAAVQVDDEAGAQVRT